MSLFSVLKSNAKLALKNNWGKAILTLLITFAGSIAISILQNTAITMFVEPISFDPALTMQYGLNDHYAQSLLDFLSKELIITLIFTVVTIFLLTPLSLGVTRWFFELVHGRSQPLGELFRFYETGTRYRRVIWYNISIYWRAYLWALLFYTIPGGMFGASIVFVSNGDAVSESVYAMATLGILLSSLLFVLATVFYAVVVNRYALAGYLLCQDDNLTVRDAIKTSIAYTKGYRFSLFWYQLSFLGWALLCIFLFPMLYVLPYMQTSVAMYARYIIEKNRFGEINGTREFVMDTGASGPVPQQFSQQQGYPPQQPQYPPQQPQYPPQQPQYPPQQPQYPPQQPQYPPQQPQYPPQQPQYPPQQPPAPEYPPHEPTDPQAPQIPQEPQSPEE